MPPFHCWPAAAHQFWLQLFQPKMNGLNMLIAIIKFTVAKADRDAAMTALLDETDTVCAMDGCIAFRPFADPQDPTGCGILHEWESEAAFKRYTTSAGFAAVGQILRPMMTTPPISRRFSAKLIETLA